MAATWTQSIGGLVKSIGSLGVNDIVCEVTSCIRWNSCVAGVETGYCYLYNVVINAISIL